MPIVVNCACFSVAEELATLYNGWLHDHQSSRVGPNSIAEMGKQLLNLSVVIALVGSANQTWESKESLMCQWPCLRLVELALH